MVLASQKAVREPWQAECSNAPMLAVIMGPMASMHSFICGLLVDNVILCVCNLHIPDRSKTQAMMCTYLAGISMHDN